MERLTIRNEIGIRVKGCRTYYGYVERKGAYTHNAIVRLAAYEDTGLTPEGINLLLNVKNDPLTLEELREIAKDKPIVVWIVHRDDGGQDYGEWAMFLSAEDMFLGNGFEGGTNNYGTAFVAYRRKPAEKSGKDLQ